MQVPRTDITVVDQRLPLRLAKRQPRRRQLKRCRNSSIWEATRPPSRLLGRKNDSDACSPNVRVSSDRQALQRVPLDLAERKSRRHAERRC
jgi:hypothetical protein